MSTLPLPEPAQEAQSEGYMPGCPIPILATPDFYTAEQMKEYAAAAVAAERERCAKVCESLVDLDDGSCDEVERCAAAIRKGTP